jgi:hypothetical protein
MIIKMVLVEGFPSPPDCPDIVVKEIPQTLPMGKHLPARQNRTIQQDGQIPL